MRVLGPNLVVVVALMLFLMCSCRPDPTSRNGHDGLQTGKTGSPSRLTKPARMSDAEAFRYRRGGWLHEHHCSPCHDRSGGTATPFDKFVGREVILKNGRTTLSVTDVKRIAKGELGRFLHKSLQISYLEDEDADSLLVYYTTPAGSW